MTEVDGPAGSSARVAWLAAASEATLGIVGLLWIRWRDLPVACASAPADVGLGTIVAIGLAAANLGLLRYGPDIAPVRSLRRFYGRVLRPLFAGMTPMQILGLSMAAGISEELLFRGAVQADWGAAMASILFGLVHIGGADMIAFGVWAGGVGALLGWLALATGGLLAPMTAHAVYDALALAYIVWVPATVSEGGEDPREPLE